MKVKQIVMGNITKPMKIIFKISLVILSTFILKVSEAFHLTDLNLIRDNLYLIICV